MKELQNLKDQQILKNIFHLERFERKRNNKNQMELFKIL
jgi:hypothetical protein